MLVNLRDLPDIYPVLDTLNRQGIRIIRALTPDKIQVVRWVLQNSSEGEAGECDVCFSRTPVSCFIAVRNKAILGYACYNTTALNFFGPTMVLEAERGKGIGKALLLRSMNALRDEGYVYGIIGGVGPAQFYSKCVGAIAIPHSTPGLYGDLIDNE
jgi:GNAT superfamily N-acetyltransferase